MSWPAAVVERVPIEHLKTAVGEAADMFRLLGWDACEAHTLGVAAVAGGITLREGGRFKTDLEAVVVAIDERIYREA